MLPDRCPALCSQSLINDTDASSITPDPVPSQPFPTSRTPVSLANDQINALRARIQVFKHISRNFVLEHVRHAIRVPNTTVADLEMNLVSLLESLMQSYQRRTRKSCGNSNHPMRGRRWIILLSNALLRGQRYSVIYPCRHPFSHFK